MFACICGGAVEVGILAALVSGLSCACTSIYNRKRRAESFGSDESDPYAEDLSEEALDEPLK